MITVEELIIRSLYHRLVLIRVRRTQESQPVSGDDNVGALQPIGSQSTLTNEAVVSSEGGLGKQSTY